MAQFQIVDEFTYEVCLLPKERALSFCDYLNSIKIRAKAKEGFSGKFYIYVTNELDLVKAKQELLRYVNSPFDPKYNKASWENNKTFSNTKEIKSSLYLPFAFNLKSLTTIVEIVCVIVYLFMFLNYEFVAKYLALSPYDRFDSILDYYKLITPVFVHFGLMHIAFNLVMFEAIGRPLEKYIGIKKYFSVFIAIAILSNLLQYLFMTSNGVFGGLSGVVYGVIGYASILSKNKVTAAYLNIPNGLLAVSVIFIFIGFFLSGIANLCHLGGLVVGVLYALFDIRTKNKI